MQNSLQDLTERLRRKTDQDREATEDLIRQSFDALSRHLNDVSQDALNTTEAAMRGHLKTLEQDFGSKCESLGQILCRPLRRLQMISLGAVLASALCLMLTVWIGHTWVKMLQREINMLTQERDRLEEANAALWSRFKGLEPYQAEGRDYLLTLPGWQIVNVGTVGAKDAWEVTRR